MRKKKNFFVITLFFLFLFLLLNVLTPISSGIKNSFLSVTFPIYRATLTAGNGFFGSLEVFQNAKEVRKEIEKLRRENRNLLSKLSILKEIERENETLRKALEMDLYQEKELVIAKVMGKDLVKQNVIVRHEEEVTEGDLVITPEGLLIGMVKETSNNFSEIKLITSTGSSFQVKVQNKDQPIGVLEGRGEKTLLLNLLPKDKEITRGDMVVGMAYEKEVMDGVFVGRILEVIENDIEAFNQAIVWQGIDYRYLDYLFVIKK